MDATAQTKHDPEGVDHPRLLAHAHTLADLLDQQFTIPGTRIRYGYDALVGLIPGIGDTATAMVGLYIIVLARRAKVGKRTQLRMAANLGVDWLIGLIPIVDIVFDVAFKANVRNVKLLERDLARR